MMYLVNLASENKYQKIQINLSARTRRQIELHLPYVGDDMNYIE